MKRSGEERRKIKRKKEISGFSFNIPPRTSESGMFHEKKGYVGGTDGLGAGDTLPIPESDSAQVHRPPHP